jgi:hypothetical protein
MAGRLSSSRALILFIPPAEANHRPGRRPGTGSGHSVLIQPETEPEVPRHLEGVMKNNDRVTLEDAVLRGSLIAAPVLMLLSGLVLPQLRGPDGTELSVSADHPGRYYACVLLGLAGSVALIPAVYGIIRRVRLPHTRLSAIGGGLAFIGAALSLVDWGGELVKVEMGALNPAYHQAMAALLDRFDSSARIAAPLQLAGIGFLLGMTLLAIALFHGRTAPGWVCIGLIAGTLGNLAGFAAGSLLVLDLGNAALVASMAYLATRPPASGNMLADQRAGDVLDNTGPSITNDPASQVR